MTVGTSAGELEPDYVAEMTDSKLTKLALLRLEQSAEARFRLSVRADVSTPFGNLYGGVGVAACIEAAEAVTDRPVQWITTQFVGAATPPEAIDLQVSVSAHGRSTTQSHVTGTVEGRPVFTSLCAHTLRPGGDRAQFVDMPDVPSPHECVPASDPFGGAPTGTFLDRIERRWATGPAMLDHLGPAERGRLALWCRVRDQAIGCAAAQAFVSDIVPLAVCAALGIRPGGTSLDNTVRIIDTDPSEWALLDMCPDGFHRSTGHGSLRIWSQDGRLMGTAQQSTIIRLEQLGPS